jgi:hypothetical protein
MPLDLDVQSHQAANLGQSLALQLQTILLFRALSGRFFSIPTNQLHCYNI